MPRLPSNVKMLPADPRKGYQAVNRADVRARLDDGWKFRSQDYDGHEPLYLKERAEAEQMLRDLEADEADMRAWRAAERARLGLPPLSEA